MESKKLLQDIKYFPTKFESAINFLFLYIHIKNELQKRDFLSASSILGKTLKKVTLKKTFMLYTLKNHR